MEPSDPQAGGTEHMTSVERTRALLMAQRARLPIYFAMLQIAVVAIAIPMALGFPILAGIGTIAFVALWATLKAIDESLHVYRLCTHLAYAATIAALAYATLGLRVSGNLTIYSTGSILLGAAYLLGTRPAILWAIPCVLLAGIDALWLEGPTLEIPPAVAIVVRTVTLGTIFAFAVSFRWEHDRQAARLQREARLDPLTGLANRLAFDEAILRSIDRASRFARRGAVVFADLDRLKSVNDRFGHDIGDALLREIGARIRELTRIIDTPARLGGDEFAILLSEFTDSKGAEVLARRLSEIICRPWAARGQEILPAVSIGIAEFTGDGETAESILRRADRAMYQAKRSDTATIYVDRDGELAEVV